MNTQDLQELFQEPMDLYNMGMITECEFWNQMTEICFEQTKTASHE